MATQRVPGAEEIAKSLAEHATWLKTSEPGYQAQAGKRADFSNLNLAGWDFSGKDLRRALFVGADCTRAIFKNANLQNADFSRVNLPYADFTDSDLFNAKFDHAWMMNAIFRRSKVWGCSFVNTNASYSFFIDAVLSYGDFRKANLFHCSFSGSDIRWARGVDLDCSEITSMKRTYDQAGAWFLLERKFSGLNTGLVAIFSLIFFLPYVIKFSTILAVSGLFEEMVQRARLRDGIINIGNASAEIVFNNITPASLFIGAESEGVLFMLGTLAIIFYNVWRVLCAYCVYKMGAAGVDGYSPHRRMRFHNEGFRGLGSIAERQARVSSETGKGMYYWLFDTVIAHVINLDKYYSWMTISNRVFKVIGFAALVIAVANVVQLAFSPLRIPVGIRVVGGLG